ncbi:hypothetical protein TanjilG_09568 [Lupinus angustifolius]|uniref:Uncharacterized protein n=1 Tax=Lupinus angustifolius TaxID=3871 RepID=A0A1J7GCG8_LUPAN|nr:hypothetical protein TanjilG_09568 [Lupinus angustifolius]
MSILFPESVLLSNTKRVIRELLQGHECATKLRFLIQNPIGSDGSTLSAEELLSNVERSFTQTISVLTSSDAEVFDEVGQIVNYGENGSHVGANSCNDLRSEDSTESKKRSLTTTIKDRRGSYKRRFSSSFPLFDLLFYSDMCC